MEEEWRSIKDYEGLYEVSNLGRVKSLERYVKHNLERSRFVKERILIPGKNSIGYLAINLYKDSIKKNISIYQLVAITFLNHIPNGYKIVVDHIDNNKLNDRLDNLQLITARKNTSKDKSTNLTGVRPQGKKFQSVITISGKTVNLGTFNTPKEANNAYVNAVLAVDNGTDIIIKRVVYSSKHLGVHFNNVDNKWRAVYKRKYLGYFTTEEEAHKRVQLEIKNITFAIN